MCSAALSNPPEIWEASRRVILKGIVWWYRWIFKCALNFLDKWPTWRTILFYVFISILCMFRATSCSTSSGESIVSIQHLVYVTLCRWPFGVQVGDLHTKRSSTQGDIYQMLYWYNWFSWWWWARGCSKRAENWNKYIEKNCASSWSFTKNHIKMHGEQNMKAV